MIMFILGKDPALLNKITICLWRGTFYDANPVKHKLGSKTWKSIFIFNLPDCIHYFLLKWLNRKVIQVGKKFSQYSY